jgi:hypothetical protein
MYEDLSKGDRDSIANYGNWLQLLTLEVARCTSLIHRPEGRRERLRTRNLLCSFGFREAWFDACWLGP